MHEYTPPCARADRRAACQMPRPTVWECGLCQPRCPSASVPRGAKANFAEQAHKRLLRAASHGRDTAQSLSFAQFSTEYSVQKYRVVAVWAESHRLVLRCGAGRYHQIRALGLLPKEDETLHGDSPHLGFGILLSTKPGAMFRVIFESTDQVRKPLGPDAVPTLAHLPQRTVGSARQST